MSTNNGVVVHVENLLSKAKIWEVMAQFGKPIDEPTKNYLTEEGLGGAETRTVGCMGWMWCQWLLKTSAAEIQQRIRSFVERGMEMQRISPKFYMRPVHDLYLLHCGIWAAGSEQLKALALAVVDSSGFAKYKPADDGELYACAWSGMLKFSILGEYSRAAREAEIIWNANRDISFRASTKELVSPWLRHDWKSFVRHQGKDFDKLWSRARKDGSVLSERRSERVVNLSKFRSVQQSWCWAHCGLALLAYRQGVEVVTDPFWMPEHSLACGSDRW
jgi:hypothetical protein